MGSNAVTDQHRSATVTVEQAGALLGISRRSAYRAAAAGQIPTIRLGRRILVPVAMLYRLLGITPINSAVSEGPSQPPGPPPVAGHEDSATG